MKLTLVLGLALTAAVTLVMFLAWGSKALVPGIVFGIVATGLQAAATGGVRGTLDHPLPVFAKRWAVGMGLRLAGIVLFALGVAIWPEVFPPIPSALGFLGVILPLLFLEIRLAR